MTSPLEHDYEPVCRAITEACIEQSIAALEAGLEAAIELHAMIAEANGDRLPLKTRWYAEQVEAISNALSALRREASR